MRTRLLSLGAVVGLVVLGALLSSGPAQALYWPYIPPLLIARPDLKITDTDVCLDPLSSQLFLDVDVKNRGNVAINGLVRLDVWVTTENETLHVYRYVTLSIPAGETIDDVPLPPVTPSSFNVALTVKAFVDWSPSYDRSFHIGPHGSWWELNEYNNARDRKFTYWVQV